MKVFVSSVIRDFGPYREAAVHAARTLGHDVRRSEDFPAMAGTPQQACLAGVRWAEVVLLLLEERYGRILGSGLSATHEEYREARERRAVLAFVQEGIDPEPNQKGFIDEVRSWQVGHVTAGFSTPDELRDAITRALHEFELSRAGGGVDPDEMSERARRLVPQRGSRWGRPSLSVVVVGGPRQAVLRPAQLEDGELARFLTRESLAGDAPVLNTEHGTRTGIGEHDIVLDQDDASVYVDDLGAVRVVQPAQREERGIGGGLPALIEEDIRERLSNGLAFAGRVMDHLDPVRRLSAILPLVAVQGVEHLAWRTRQEHAQSPSSVSIPMRPGAEPVVLLDPPIRPRAALHHDLGPLVDDFVSVLRRRLRS